MIRVEIIGNRSIQEDLEEILKKYKVGGYRTLIPEVHGTGSSGPRRGDHIWPEDNFIMIIYCKKDEAEKIRQAVMELKNFFKQEGIKMFTTKALDI